MGAQGCSHGELYAGFILLNDTDPIPSCVQPGPLPPAICSNFDTSGQTPLPGRQESFATSAALAAAAGYPIYTLDPAPNGLTESDRSLFLLPDGTPFAAVIGFATATSMRIRVWSYGEYPQPRPLRSLSPDSEDDWPAITLEKAAFLPQAGIFIDSGEDFVSNWIESEVHYQMLDSHSASRTSAIALAATLLQVS